jgi:flagellar basal body P-ring formation protein FlgA
MKLNRTLILSLFFGCLGLVCLSEASLFASEQLILEQSKVAAAIRNHIEKHMSWEKGTVRVTFPSGITEIALPSNNFKLEVKENKNDEFIGERLYHVKILHKNLYFRQISVPTRIEVCKDIVLSSKPLKRDNNISSQDIIVEEKWFTRLPQDLLTDPENVIGRRLLRSVNSNTPFTLSMLSNPILFKKGKVVKIICDNEALNITTLGLAEEEGVYGAMVKVKNISSNKIIQGRVIGDSVVRVEI